ncbi:hypothetical protein P7K49_022937 [Saguinus oedipus]|uniref:Uncharacterized protein n=1 Tax=Saguinus oedipus TaxID=9490 RepID=A0ABQ9UK75_SAGOE|nr:hypothetical protein P7K49_022937 [Saguinus oedipus]
MREENRGSGSCDLISHPLPQALCTPLPGGFHWCSDVNMVQRYQSPVRVYKYPFELVMALNTCPQCGSDAGEVSDELSYFHCIQVTRKAGLSTMEAAGVSSVEEGPSVLRMPRSQKVCGWRCLVEILA